MAGKRTDFYLRAKDVVAKAPVVRTPGGVSGKLVVAGPVSKDVVAKVTINPLDARLPARQYDATAPRPTIVTEDLVQFGLEISPYTFRDGLLLRGVDLVGVADVPLLNTTKRASDPVSASDAATMQPGKGLLEAVSLGDAMFLVVSKGLVDVAATGDSAAKEVSKALSDFASHAELVETVHTRASYEREPAEYVLAADLLESFLSKVLADAAAVSDVASVSFSRPSVEMVYAGDVHSSSVGKAAVEVLSASDAVFGFCDSYFAEDYVQPGYTGTILTPV